MKKTNEKAEKNIKTKNAERRNLRKKKDDINNFLIRAVSIIPFVLFLLSHHLLLLLLLMMCFEVIADRRLDMYLQIHHRC